MVFLVVHDILNSKRFQFKTIILQPNSHSKYSANYNQNSLKVIILIELNTGYVCNTKFNLIHENVFIPYLQKRQS